MANFEAIALKHLLEDGIEIIPELHKDLFTDRYNKLFILCLDYFDANKKLPTITELKAIVESKAPLSVKPQYLATVDLLTKLDTEGIDVKTTISELKDQKVLRDVDTLMVELVEAQRDKDSTKVRQLLNKLNEKVNLRGLQLTDFSDAKDSEEEHSIVPSFLGKDYEHLIGGGHTGLVIYGAASGGGKALSNDTKIPTPLGFMPMGELKVGDHVFGRDGKPTYVTGVFPQGKRPTYRITLKDGRSVLADGEHLWNVRVRGCKSEKVVTTTDMLDMGLHKKRHDKRYNTTQHEATFYVPLCEPVEYSEKEYTIPPYVLGAVIGDGSTCNRGMINYTSADTELIGFIKTDVGTGAEVADRKALYSYGIIKCPEYVDYLRNNNMVCTSEYKHIPEEYLLGSIRQRELLLQGLLDTDGYVSSASTSIEFSTVSKSLSENVETLVHSLGGTCNTSIKDNAGYRDKLGNFIQCKRVYRQHIRFSNTSSIQPFRLPRKKNRYSNTNKKPYIAITSIEYVGDTECTCISVAATDKLFLCGSYIVTHNTVLLLQTAINNYLAGNNVLFVSLELPRSVLYKRLIAHITGIDFTRINSKELTEEEAKECSKAHDQFFSKSNKNWFKIIDDSVTDNELTNIIAVKSQLDSLHTVCIDYLNLVEIDTSDDWKGLSRLAKKLHRLTRTHNVSIISAAQINSEGRTKGSIVPNISTRGSKELEFSASQFFYVDVEQDTKMLVCYTKKNRIARPKHFILEPDFAHMAVIPTDIVLEE